MTDGLLHAINAAKPLSSSLDEFRHCFGISTERLALMLESLAAKIRNGGTLVLGDGEGTATASITVEEVEVTSKASKNDFCVSELRIRLAEKVRVE